MGNASTTQPSDGFQNPKLAQIFSAQNTMTAVTALATNDHSQSSIPVGAISGGIIGGFILTLSIAVFFLLRRRQRMVAPPQLPQMSASVETQELQECGLYELHDPRNVSELPPPPIESGCSVPETTDR